MNIDPMIFSFLPLFILLYCLFLKGYYLLYDYPHNDDIKIKPANENKFSYDNKKSNKKFEFTEEELELELEKNKLLKYLYTYVTEIKERYENFDTYVTEIKKRYENFDILLTNKQIIEFENQLEREKNLQKNIEFENQLEREKNLQKIMELSLKLSRAFIVNARLEKLKYCYVMEYIPEVNSNVLMIYDNDNNRFNYYCNTEISLEYLKKVGKKYVKLFNCEPVFIENKNSYVFMGPFSNFNFLNAKNQVVSSKNYSMSFDEYKKKKFEDKLYK